MRPEAKMKIMCLSFTWKDLANALACASKDQRYLSLWLKAAKTSIWERLRILGTAVTWSSMSIIGRIIINITSKEAAVSWESGANGLVKLARQSTLM